MLEENSLSIGAGFVIQYSAAPSQCKIQNCGGNESNQSKENSLPSQTLGLLGLKTGI